MSVYTDAAQTDWTCCKLTDFVFLRVFSCTENHPTKEKANALTRPNLVFKKPSIYSIFMCVFVCERNRLMAASLQLFCGWCWSHIFFRAFLHLFQLWPSRQWFLGYVEGLFSLLDFLCRLRPAFHRVSLGWSGLLIHDLAVSSDWVSPQTQSANLPKQRPVRQKEWSGYYKYSIWSWSV